MTAWTVAEPLLILGAVLTTAGMMVWGERRGLAWVQERYGPNRTGPFGLLQLVADVIKLMTKEDWIPPFADRGVFVLAPAIVVTTGLLSFAIIPVSDELGVMDLDVGLLFFLGMGGLASYAAVLGGWASNNKYSLIGGLRAAAQAMSYEVFMALSVLGVVAIAGTLDLRAIVDAQQTVWNVLLQPIGFVVFLIAGVAHMHRLPFDLPESDAELVAGFHSEYSSMKFGMFFVGEYIAMVVIAGMTTTLFLGGWHGPLLPGWLWFAGKVLVLLAFFVLVRGALPRPRFDQLMGAGWKVFLPLTLANLLITGALVLVLDPGVGS